MGARRFGSALVIGVVTLGSLGLVVGANDVCFAQESSPGQSTTSVPDIQTPKYTADGKLIAFAPQADRQWIFVGTPVTPNDLNDGDASFPEIHNVYIDRTAFRQWQ